MNVSQTPLGIGLDENIKAKLRVEIEEALKNDRILNMLLERQRRFEEKEAKRVADLKLRARSKDGEIARLEKLRRDATNKLYGLKNSRRRLLHAASISKCKSCKPAISGRRMAVVADVERRFKIAAGLAFRKEMM
jgi:hypothetical protein